MDSVPDYDDGVEALALRAVGMGSLLFVILHEILFIFSTVC